MVRVSATNRVEEVVVFKWLWCNRSPRQRHLSVNELCVPNPSQLQHKCIVTSCGIHSQTTNSTVTMRLRNRQMIITMIIEYLKTDMLT
jgi:hypothetical protein